MASKKALVFGGSSGIGEAAAAALADASFVVSIVGRNRERLAAAQARLGGVTTYAADASDRQAVERVFAATGEVDAVVIAVSGGKGAGSFVELSLDDLREALEKKLIAQLTVAQAAARSVKAGGSITFVTAASARSVIRGTSGLAAVNAALEAVVPILALELAPVRVNAISPGIIDTPWWESMPAELKSGFFEKAAATLPVGRVGTPPDVGAVAALLAGSGFVTGSVYEVDGGCHLVTQ